MPQTPFEPGWLSWELGTRAESKGLIANSDTSCLHEQA